jgi:Ca-activated chloride channel family protein
MLARDVAPDRLTRAKLAITDLAERLQGDRLGLIAFAGTAFLQCPLTLDHAAFLESLGALQPGIIEAPGSDLASALDVAEQALRSEKRNVKLLVLVSDGEDLGGAGVEAAKRIAAEGVRVFTIGVGSAAGELVPATKASAGTDFIRDEAGRFVQSRLDEDTLRQIADATGGFYEPLGARGEGIEAVVDRAIAPIPKEELASRMRRVPVNRYAWPLAAAILLLAIEMVLGERRREAPWRWRRRRSDRGDGPRTDEARAAALLFPLALVAAGGLLAATARSAVASPDSARQLFEAGEYERALAEYKAAVEADPEDPRLDFNVGASAYKAGRFDDAATAFARALRSESADLQEQSFYNLGNAQFRLGEKALQSDPHQTMQAWQQSIEAYDQALALRADDADAKHNRDLVQAALEELRKQQQQQQQEKNDSEQQEKKEQKEGQQQEQQAGDAGERSEDDEQRNGGKSGGEGGESPPHESADSDPGAKDEQRADDEQKGESPGTPSDQHREGKQAGGDPAPDQHRPEQQPSSPGGETQQANGDQPPADGPAQARNEQGPPPAGSAGAAQQAPGQLSAEDARQLLDSLRGDEQRVPALAGQSGGAPRDAGAVRDW